MPHTLTDTGYDPIKSSMDSRFAAAMDIASKPTIALADKDTLRALLNSVSDDLRAGTEVRGDFLEECKPAHRGYVVAIVVDYLRRKL
jgi:hypothetical protein